MSIFITGSTGYVGSYVVTILLRGHREGGRIEWRGPALELLAETDRPYRAPVFALLRRVNSLARI